VRNICSRFPFNRSVTRVYPQFRLSSVYRSRERDYPRAAVIRVRHRSVDRDRNVTLMAGSNLPVSVGYQLITLIFSSRHVHGISRSCLFCAGRPCPRTHVPGGRATFPFLVVSSPRTGCSIAHLCGESFARGISLESKILNFSRMHI